MSVNTNLMSDIEQPSPQLRVSPVPTLRIGKSERTRAAVLNAALDFLWSRPFREMTVSGLMAPTGVSRAAFYQYFKDIHEVMEALLEMLQAEIFAAAEPWIAGIGDPVARMREAIAGLVRVSYRRGPFLRAIFDAASDDDRLEKVWAQFLAAFDDAACARIEADQAQGLIAKFEARPVAIALNRLDAYALVDAFGRRPRGQREPVEQALARIWVSTLYGAEWLGNESSDLVRK
jgi:AcrR family transcriptional regulator